jgi:DNA polymerase-3 subunit alpha
MSKINEPLMADVEEWDEKTRLNLEKESLGFYISGHPLDQYEALLEKYTNANALTIGEVSDKAAIRIGGTISSIKTIRTKKGDPMAFVNIEDMHGAVEAVIFPKVYESVSDFLVQDFPVLIQGEAQKDEKGVKLLAEWVVPMEKAEETWTASVHITVDVTSADKGTLESLREILSRYSGSCAGFIHLKTPESTETVIRLPDDFKLNATPEMIREINGFLGYSAVDTRCSDITLNSNQNNGYNGAKRRRSGEG